MKIFCIGRNYVDHAKELNNPVPKKPLVFSKFPTALLHKGKPLFYPEFSKDVHYEGELVLKMCRNGKYIPEEFAHSYFEEITVGIDFTARDLQAELKKKGHPWEIAKGFNGSAPIGDFINKNSLKDPNNIHFSLNKNGETVQKGASNDMIFNFAHLISYVSQFFLIGKGDLIFTGTPVGVGPIAIGDYFEGFIEDQRLMRCEIK